MSAVERLEHQHGDMLSPKQPDPAVEPSLGDVVGAPIPASGRAKLRPLLALAPYVARYRTRALLALVALTIAALTTLTVPVAVRRMIDFGFTPRGIALIT